MRIGEISQIVYPQYSHCYKCGTTWNLVEPHHTNYENGVGCFPLCEECWDELTIVERVPYYRMLFDEWNKQSNGRETEDLWIKIKKAVLKGK